jgi:hypothetical protein
MFYKKVETLKKHDKLEPGRSFFFFLFFLFNRHDHIQGMLCAYDLCGHLISFMQTHDICIYIHTHTSLRSSNPSILAIMSSAALAIMLFSASKSSMVLSLEFALFDDDDDEAIF